MGQTGPTRPRNNPIAETVFASVTECGIYVIFASAFLSCLALPIPTSLKMLTGGAFVAAGDLTFWGVGLAAYVGAVAGDQAGHFVGRTGGFALAERLARSPSRRAVLNHARALVDRGEVWACFFRHGPSRR